MNTTREPTDADMDIVMQALANPTPEQLPVVEAFGAALERRMLLMQAARELIRMQDATGYEGISPELEAVVGYFSTMSGFSPERIVADFREVHD